MSKYREQYDRMKRWLGRMSEVGGEGRAEVSEESLTDEALAFFESCLHLRDWIKNDKELPAAVRDAAYPYVNASSALGVCYDIAIGAKHLTVDWPKAKGKKPRLRAERRMEQRPAEAFHESEDEETFLPPGYVVHIVAVRVMVEMDGREARDAVAFAVGCVKEWDTFFELHGLT